MLAPRNQGTRGDGVMAKTSTIILYLDGGPAGTIVDDNRREYTDAEAREAMNAGRVVDFNLAFKRLHDLNYDRAALAQQYADMDRARGRER